MVSGQNDDGSEQRYLMKTNGYRQSGERLRTKWRQMNCILNKALKKIQQSTTCITNSLTIYMCTNRYNTHLLGILLTFHITYVK